MEGTVEKKEPLQQRENAPEVGLTDYFFIHYQHLVDNVIRPIHVFAGEDNVALFSLDTESDFIRGMVADTMRKYDFQSQLSGMPRARRIFDYPLEISDSLRGFRPEQILRKKTVFIDTQTRSTAQRIQSLLARIKSYEKNTLGIRYVNTYPITSLTINLPPTPPLIMSYVELQDYHSVLVRSLPDPKRSSGMPPS